MEGLASILDIDGGYFLDMDGVGECLVEGILDGIEGYFHRLCGGFIQIKQFCFFYNIIIL